MPLVILNISEWLKVLWSFRKHVLLFCSLVILTIAHGCFFKSCLIQCSIQTTLKSLNFASDLSKPFMSMFCWTQHWAPHTQPLQLCQPRLPAILGKVTESPSGRICLQKDSFFPLPDPVSHRVHTAAQDPHPLQSLHCCSLWAMSSESPLNSNALLCFHAEANCWFCCAPQAYLLLCLMNFFP